MAGQMDGIAKRRERRGGDRRKRAAAGGLVLAMLAPAGAAMAQGHEGEPAEAAGEGTAASIQAADAAGEGLAALFEAGLHWVTLSIEIAGIAAIVLGAAFATAIFLWRLARGTGGEEAFHALRSSLGRSILLGLEFLVAADIIATVAIEPTLRSLAVLAGIVAIRTFLSFTMVLEIEGRWPWQSRRD
jgi:uncharacterized membrane protein